MTVCLKLAENFKSGPLMKKLCKSCLAPFLGVNLAYPKSCT